MKFLGTAVVLGVTGELTIQVQEELMGEGKSLIGIVEGDSKSQTVYPPVDFILQAGKVPL